MWIVDGRKMEKDLRELYRTTRFADKEKQIKMNIEFLV